MSEFILCDRVFNEHTLRTQCGVNINDLLDDRCKPPKRVDPHTPYVLNGTATLKVTSNDLKAATLDAPANRTDT